MRVIAIDFDNTLYVDGKIKYKEIINKYFENPENFIIIYTSRSYSQYNFIRDILIKNDIKFHGIVCEKLRADIYIDDKNSGGLKWS